jgi:ribosomal protein S18 acetylase RimI-like enzyme
MSLSQSMPRKAKPIDKNAILTLYKIIAVAEQKIARTSDEITDNYVTNFISKSLETGIILVIENPTDTNQIIAEIHTYKVEPKVFHHVLTELTIVVHPDFQGIGLGKRIFQALLDEVQKNKPEIVRVELLARESNYRAIELYKKLGFIIEGVLANRISDDQDHYEADISMAWFNPNAVIKKDPI